MVSTWLRSGPLCRGAGLALLWLAIPGCGDWPHFDYAAGPVLQVSEQAEGDTDVVQYLHTLHDDVQISGHIETVGYTLYDDAPFDLEGWYFGDIDWYEFTLRDPQDAALRLSWAQEAADLDLYLFTASSTGELSLESYEAQINDGEVELVLEGMTAGTIYVVAVAGHQGEPVDYSLLLQFST